MRERLTWQRLSPLSSPSPSDAWQDEVLDAVEAHLSTAEVAAQLAALETAAEYPAAVIDALRPLGLSTLWADRPGRPSRVTAHHLTALNVITARASGSLSITLGVNGLALLGAYLAASDEQLTRIGARVEAGAFAALLLTELDHGSNLLANQTRAELVDGRYRLSGDKDLINGARHELLFVLARTSEPSTAEGNLGATFDFSLLFIDRAAPPAAGERGIEAGRRWLTMPTMAADVGGFRFRDTPVPVEDRIGRAGEGFLIVQKTLTISRGGVSGFAAGCASRARELARAYAAARRIYDGQPIAQLGAIAGHLQRLEALELVVAALSVKQAAMVNALGVGAAHYTTAAKYACCKLAEECVDEGRRVLGARALLRDLPYERLVRDVLLYGVFDGTTHLVLELLATRAAQLAAQPEPQRPTQPGAGDKQPDSLATLRDIYSRPPRSLVEALRQGRPRPLGLPLVSHLAALAALPGAVELGPLVDLARAFLDVARALGQSARWQADQSLRFCGGAILGLFEALSALVELADPDRRPALGMAALQDPDGSHAYAFAVRMMGARLAREIRALALEGGSAPPVELARAETALHGGPSR